LRVRTLTSAEAPFSAAPLKLTPLNNSPLRRAGRDRWLRPVCCSSWARRAEVSSDGLGDGAGVRRVKEIAPGQDERRLQARRQPFAHRQCYVAPVRRIHVPTEFTKPDFTVRDKFAEIETIYRAYQVSLCISFRCSIRIFWR